MDESILARLRALQGASQGTRQAQNGMADAMARVKNRISNDPQSGVMPPTQAAPSMDRPPGPGALSPEEKAVIQQKVDAMNARIKTNDDAQTAKYNQEDADLGKFPMLRKRMGK